MRIRQCLQWLPEDDNCQPFPGKMQPGYSKFEGKVLCQGAIVGVTNECLFRLAATLQAGAGRTAEWSKLAIVDVLS